MNIKAIIFDVDGTLADTEEGHRQAFNKAFAEAGLNWHWDLDLYDKLLAVTGGKERIRYFLDDFQTLFLRLFFSLFFFCLFGNLTLRFRFFVFLCLSLLGHGSLAIREPLL